MHVCLLMPCGHLLGKGWSLGSRLWCLIVALSLSHWYPGSGVVLDCIDSWSLPSFLLCNNSSTVTLPDYVKTFNSRSYRTRSHDWSYILIQTNYKQNKNSFLPRTIRQWNSFPPDLVHDKSVDIAYRHSQPRRQYSFMFLTCTMGWFQPFCWRHLLCALGSTEVDALWTVINFDRQASVTEMVQQLGWRS